MKRIQKKRQFIIKSILIILISMSLFLSGCTEETNPINTSDITNDNTQSLTNNTENSTNSIEIPENTYYIIEQNQSFIDINQAMNKINKSQTMLIGPGIYHLSVELNKSITLKGSNYSDPPLFILPEESTNLITLNASNCIIENIHFMSTNQNTDSNFTAGLLMYTSQNKIINSTFHGFHYGVRIRSYTSGNRIYSNHFLNNTDGLEVVNSMKNTIKYNRFYNHSRFAVYIGWNANDNSIQENDFYDNVEAIRIKSCYDNSAIHNNLYNNTMGVQECCGAEGKNTIRPNITHE